MKGEIEMIINLLDLQPNNISDWSVMRLNLMKMVLNKNSNLAW